MMERKGNCPVCGSTCSIYFMDSLNIRVFYTCPVCGRYEDSNDYPFDGIDINHLAPYLFYHMFNDDNPSEYRYHTTLSKDICDKYTKEFSEGNIRNGHPVHMDGEIIENWYPKSFADRIDSILLYLGNHTKHIGQQISFSYQEMLSLLFVDRREESDSKSNENGGLVSRNKRDCLDEEKYMLDNLEESGFIAYSYGTTEDKALYIRLTPKGYSRIDELQKNTGYGKNALVAMKFGNETIPLREAIRKGISDAGYIAVFIDEVQHNDFITPELLKHIRDSKFVVADLTHQNNGAYFEEGYAMGLGKPVIQLCKKGVYLHFDIAQKNTIMWDTETDIPERLTNRIKATID